MCNCSCNDNVTSLQGERGSDGATTGVSTGVYSTSAAAARYLITKSRLNTSSNNVYNGGNGYQWTIATIPAVSASNVAVITLTAQINAGGDHIMTLSALYGGAPVASVSSIQNCGLWSNICMQFEIQNVSEANDLIIKFLSDTAGVTPLLTNAHATIDIYC